MIPWHLIAPRNNKPLHDTSKRLVPRRMSRIPRISRHNAHRRIVLGTTGCEDEVHPVGAVGVDLVPDAAELEIRVFVDEGLFLPGKVVNCLCWVMGRVQIGLGWS